MPHCVVKFSYVITQIMDPKMDSGMDTSGPHTLDDVIAANALPYDTTLSMEEMIGTMDQILACEVFGGGGEGGGSCRRGNARERPISVGPFVESGPLWRIESNENLRCGAMKRQVI